MRMNKYLQSFDENFDTNFCESKSFDLTNEGIGEMKFKTKIEKFDC